MAGIATTVWEFRPSSGSANAGGGYDTAAGTTDYSNQDSAQLQLTDLATGGIGSTALSSATGGFTAAMVGNYIQIRSGTNVTAGWYRVTAHADTNNVTIDRAADDGVGAVASGSGDLGGALDILTDTFLDDTGSMVAGNTVYIKNDGTMTLTGSINLVNDGTGQFPITIEGYNSSRGDDPTTTSRPTIACAANTFILDNYWTIKNLIFTITTGVGVRVDTGGLIVNCKCTNSSGTGDRNAFTLQTGRGRIIGCEAISTNGAAIDLIGGSSTVVGCYIHDSVDGVQVTDVRQKIVGNVIDTCTNGINGTTEHSVLVYNNTIYNCTNGILEDTGDSWIVLNNIIDACGTGASWATTEKLNGYWDYNCWDNTSDTNNVTKGANAVTGDPGMTDPANGDFTLTQGSNCLNAGFAVGTNQGVTGSYFTNIGADQHDFRGSRVASNKTGGRQL